MDMVCVQLSRVRCFVGCGDGLWIQVMSIFLRMNGGVLFMYGLDITGELVKGLRMN